MNKSFSKIALLSSLLVIANCKPTNPNLYGNAPAAQPLPEIPVPQSTVTEGVRPTQPPLPAASKVVAPPPIEAAKDPSKYTQIDDQIYKPNVDILVLMDTSDSMKDDQDRLKKNIKLFSKGFLDKKQFLNFHIGVVTAWDSISFGDGEQKNCKLGQLRPLGGIKGPFKGNCTAATAAHSLPYITNDSASSDSKLNSLLGSTLAFGVELFKRGKDGKATLESGPQHEEIFSPIIAALRPEAQNMNDGFRRPDAHLAVILFTDTDDFDYNTIQQDLNFMDANTRSIIQKDTQNLTDQEKAKYEVLPSEIAQFLKSQEKDNTTVSLYAALARYDDMTTHGQTTGVYKEADYYIQQPGRGPKKIVELLKLMNGTGFDLRDGQYGKKLSEIGDDIVKKSLRRVIVLDYTPAISTKNPKDSIVVKYGDKIIQQDDKKGWRYEIEEVSSGSRLHKIIISEEASITPIDGARFSVTYIPASQPTKVQ